MLKLPGASVYAERGMESAEAKESIEHDVQMLSP
jgi:hypothetical protein